MYFNLTEAFKAIDPTYRYYVLKKKQKVLIIVDYFDINTKMPSAFF